MRKRRPLFVFILFLLLACGGAEEEKIRQVLNQRGEALQKKDLSLYVSCISESYRDRGEDFDRLRERIRGYFEAFDRIQYRLWDQSIQVEGEEAVVIQQFHLEVEKGGKKNAHSGREALSLRKESGGWKIVRGL